MERGKIILRMAYSAEEKIVDGFVDGPLCIHPVVDGPGWMVTHRETGLSLTKTLTQDVAETVVAELLTFGDAVWDFGDAREFVDAAEKSADDIQAICKKYFNQ